MPQKRGKPKDPTKYHKINSKKKNTKKTPHPAYDQYIQSDAWKRKRGHRILIDKKTCQMCGAKKVLLHAHHIRYDSFGHEDMRDLITLCPKCHEIVHAELKTRDADKVVRALSLISEMNFKDWQKKHSRS